MSSPRRFYPSRSGESMVRSIVIAAPRVSAMLGRPACGCGRPVGVSASRCVSTELCGAKLTRHSDLTRADRADVERQVEIGSASKVNTPHTRASERDAIDDRRSEDDRRSRRTEGGDDAVRCSDQVRRDERTNAANRRSSLLMQLSYDRTHRMLFCCLLQLNLHRHSLLFQLHRLMLNDQSRRRSELTFQIHRACTPSRAVCRSVGTTARDSNRTPHPNSRAYCSL
jgi:hypothetical protein